MLLNHCLTGVTIYQPNKKGHVIKVKTKPKDKRKHIAVSEHLKSEFNMLSKLKKKTHEQLLRYLINLEIK